MRPEITTLLASRLRTRIEKQIKPVGEAGSQYILFFTFSDKKSHAQTIITKHADFAQGWQNAITEMRSRISSLGLKIRWLRVDWVSEVEKTTWQQLRDGFEKIKRNYFRKGISLDASFNQAFLETELNANAMLYGGAHIANAIINEKNFLHFARKRFDLETIDFSPDKEIFTFTTGAMFTTLEEPDSYILHGTGRNAGRRVIDKLDAVTVNELIENASLYLTKQVKMNGRFHYGWHPCFDRPIPSYNALRHASSLYAMIEAWEVTRDHKLKEAIDLSLNCLTAQLIRQIQLPDGQTASYLVEANKEIKLGGNAVCLLALTKYSQLTGTQDYLTLLEQLALGITAMQDPETGKFNHVFRFPSLELKEEFRIIYYDGEAAFGLMRLYALTQDERWLSCVEKAFEYFIKAEHWKAHDHWLSYCVNELTIYRPKEKYFRFGIQNVADYLDFVHHRITTFPTLLELMMAAREMLSRISTMPKMQHLLDQIDLLKFYLALEHRAHYLLNGYFWPELAMFYEQPQKILGSFFIRHHSFRVRIDDVEHYLSGFIAYLRYLKIQRQFFEFVSNRAQIPPPETTINEQTIPTEQFNWTSAKLLQATGGEWVQQPPRNWGATGLCIFAPAMQNQNIVVAKSHLTEKGVLPVIIKKMSPPPAAIISSNPETLGISDIPVLKVSDIDKTILDMGSYARHQIKGHVCAVTGSAGKTTTTAMLAHVLEAYGTTERSVHNANRPYGVAWNLASFDWNSEHIVLELAVGMMGRSARMASPKLAIFTNILPVHLSDTTTLHDIAVTKSAIFSGMKPGDTAILNKNMQEWPTVLSAAQARRLNIIEYGCTSDCEFQLIDYRPQTRQVTASLRGIKIRYELGAEGEHMALNSIAILAAVTALNYPLNDALQKLSVFNALSGRGEQSQLTIDGKPITLIDDAYNANTGSMKAALENLATHTTAPRRIAVLGQMAELGLNAEQYHTDLAEFIAGLPVDKVFVTGEHYKNFWQCLPDAIKGAYAPSMEELKTALREQIEEQDTILFKGSNSTKIHELVTWIKNIAAQ